MTMQENETKMNINTKKVTCTETTIALLTKTEHHPPPLGAHQLITLGITQLHLASVTF